jgi:hypothetical protein
MDPVLEAFKRFPLSQPIPDKLVYDMYDASLRATGRFPQEGERCRAYISLDLAHLRHHRGILDRQLLARTAIVPLTVYHRYLEVILDALDASDWLDLPILVRNFNLGPLQSAAERIFARIIDGSAPSSQDKRAYLAVSVLLAASLRPGHVDLELIAAAAMCSANKTLPGYVKAAKAKCKDLMKELKKSVQSPTFISAEDEHLASNEIDALRDLKTAMHDDDAQDIRLSPVMLLGTGQGIYEFCGLPPIIES